MSLVMKSVKWASGNLDVTLIDLSQPMLERATERIMETRQNHHDYGRSKLQRSLGNIELMFTGDHLTKMQIGVLPGQYSLCL